MVLPKVPTVRARREIGTALSEINVTPFIDVMLVLLVIFMITAPMMQSGVEVNLPTAETATVRAEEGVRVTVTPDRFIHVGLSAVNINLLERNLQNAFLGKSKKVVYFHADQSLPYGYVMDVLDVIYKAGVEQVGLMTAPEEAPPAERRK